MANVTMIQQSNPKFVEILANDFPWPYQKGLLNISQIERVRKEYIEGAGINVLLNTGDKFTLKAYTTINGSPVKVFDQVGSNTDITSDEILYQELKNLINSIV